jgi:tetratricopeptide (TPR) repeat protein
MTEKPSVFISYSHLDSEWKDRFVRQLRVSVKQGRFAEWNDGQIRAGEDWHKKITTAMDAASVGVFLISADFLGSNFIQDEEVTHLIERREREGIHIVPVYLHKCDWEAVDWLTGMQMRPAGDRWIVRGEDHIITEEFADIAKEIRLLLEGITKKHPRAARAVGLNKPPDPTRLPRVGEHLFGRERELALLDGAWADEETNIISLVAWGGVGKSALVKHWLGAMARDEFRGASRVYGWSFYKQSLREDEASADEFFADALRWFDAPNPEELRQTERARRLAELIQQERTLLILDGLEPLQHSSRTGTEGQIRDQTLAELVRLLAWHNPGLLVITSRYVVDDIRDQRATTSPVIELGHLSPEAGAQLLRALGVEGEQEELEAASREFGGHSLALNLLGSYLRDILDGDVRKRGEVSLLEEDAEHGGHARRIMRSYKKQFGDSPELAVLHLIGMFDRPANRELIRVLRRRPVIEGLNEKLVGQSDLKWKRTLARLRNAKLLLETSVDEIDAHPLVREHFRERLRREKPEAWRAGHGRLYEHLKRSAKQLPDTLAEMAPMFQAMHHGCQAGRHQEVLNEVYWARISRRDDFYGQKKLGAFGADLAALAGLFDRPWESPVATLTEPAQGYILNQAAFDLRALGRLREAVAPMRASLDVCVTMQDWREAAKRAGSLSELHLALGDVAEAVAMGKASVDHADRSGDTFMRMCARSFWADALHQAGQAARAQVLFAASEGLQGVWHRHEPWLYSIRGYQYCDLMLTQGRAAEARDRAGYALDLAQRHLGKGLGLHDIALDRVSLGQAALALDDHGEARKQLDQAVDGLRQAGVIEYLSRGLLARAALFRQTDDFGAAWRDLDEATRIAGRSEMRLFQCDAHLEYARLALVEGNRENAREHAAEARRLVEETGYGRRRPEVEALEAEVG